MRQALRVAVATAMLAATFSGCSMIWNPKERAHFENAKQVIHVLPTGASGAVSFDMGPYQGGTAVLGEQHTAFWIKDGVPYAVSEAARSAAPDMAHAPESIQYNDEFIAAAKGES